MGSFVALLLAEYYSGDQIGEDERGGACSTNSIDEKFIQGVSGKKGSNEPVAKLCIGDQIILKCCRL
jgi:hypothetical protein